MTPTLLTLLALVILGALVAIVKLKAKLDAQGEASESEAKTLDVAGYAIHINRLTQLSAILEIQINTLAAHSVSVQNG